MLLVCDLQDKLTKTKTVEGILAGLTLSGVHEYTRQLTQQFLEASGVADEEAGADASTVCGYVHEHFGDKLAKRGILQLFLIAQCSF